MAPRKRIIQSLEAKVRNGESSKPPKSRRKEEEPSGLLHMLLLCLLMFAVLGAISIYLFVDLKPLLEHLGFEPSTNVTDKASKEATDSKVKKGSYQKTNITNAADNKIRSDLDAADSALEKGKYTDALKKYDAILKKYPKSPRATFGRGQAINRKAEAERSNSLLEQSIDQLLKVLDLPEVPKALFVKAGTVCADRQTFRGWGFKAVNTIQKLIDAYPNDMNLRNALGVKYLMVHRNEEARGVFEQTLTMDPDNGFAKVHLGFILKAVDHKYSEAIPYLRDGINSKVPGVVDGRFFFHLGDALHRTGESERALEVYEQGAEQGVFMSKWQRSLYNVEGIAARPWWTHQQTGNAKFLKMLEDNWKVIRDEGLAQMDPKTGSFVFEEEDLRESGDWKQFTLFVQGRKNEKNCAKAPKTCAIVGQFADIAKCRRGQVKFSVMHPGVHVWPHTGPTNCRLRSHLGLVIPEGPRLRVVQETRGWQEGKAFVFDDSFEHEVWHDGQSLRLVLIADMWHPEITPHQKQTLPAI